MTEDFAMVIVVAGAMIAGFTTGFAGFGTGLVASGLWFYALPAAMVPPLVALSSVAAQVIGLFTVKSAFDWRRSAPFIAGGIVGVPLGVAALLAASPGFLRTSVGVFLVGYTVYQFTAGRAFAVGDWGGKPADAVVGVGGGFLGGFAGLSGPLPLIWLQLRGWPAHDQRAAYQPFNIVVLILASAAMTASGQLDLAVAGIALTCLPATVLGAWLGARAYTVVSPDVFRRIILGLLCVSGWTLIIQSLAL